MYKTLNETSELDFIPPSRIQSRDRLFLKSIQTLHRKTGYGSIPFPFLIERVHVFSTNVERTWELWNSTRFKVLRWNRPKTCRIPHSNVCRTSFHPCQLQNQNIKVINFKDTQIYCTSMQTVLGNGICVLVGLLRPRLLLSLVYFQSPGSI